MKDKIRPIEIITDKTRAVDVRSSRLALAIIRVSERLAESPVLKPDICMSAGDISKLAGDISPLVYPARDRR